MKFYLAPLEGITGHIYRNALEKYFPGTDRYFTPFIVPDQRRTLRTKELRDILPENNRVGRLIPQILTNDPQRFREAVRALEDYGYEEVNLNLGCPSGTVVSRKRGAGFLGEPELLDRFLEQIFRENQARISVKTRIGLDSPQEVFHLVEIYNRYPLSELIIHPRTRQEFYRGSPHLEIFEEILPLCRAPVCYNGNLLTREDYEAFTGRFPQVEAVMLGRGVIADPGLIRGLRQGKGRMEKRELRAFHDEVFAGYREIFQDENNAVSRMKELWIYLIHSFENGERYGKKIHKSKGRGEYLCQVDQLFASCGLREAGPVDWHLPQR